MKARCIAFAAAVDEALPHPWELLHIFLKEVSGLPEDDSSTLKAAPHLCGRYFSLSFRTQKAGSNFQRPADIVFSGDILTK